MSYKTRTSFESTRLWAVSFSSKIHGKEQKTRKRASVTVSVTCERRCCEPLEAAVPSRSQSRSRAWFAFSPHSFRGKERLLAVNESTCRRWSRVAHVNFNSHWKNVQVQYVYHCCLFWSRHRWWVNDCVTLKKRNQITGNSVCKFWFFVIGLYKRSKYLSIRSSETWSKPNKDTGPHLRWTCKI